MGRFNKVKEGYGTWKSWMKNPRYKALAMLGFWLIFFTILYLLATIAFSRAKEYDYSDSGSNSQFNEVDNLIETESLEFNYVFTYIKDDKEENVKVEGTFYDDKYYFIIGDKEYYDDGILYLVNRNERTLTEVILDIPISRDEISISGIYAWLDKGILEEETEYKDGSKSSNYYYQGEEYGIPMTVSVKDKFITYIKIDLKEYMDNERFDVEISYANINNISTYVRNFSEYTIMHEGE